MISGIVVLYHPESDIVIKNINSYIGLLDNLLIIDNSDNVFSKEIIEYYKHNNSVQYIQLGENKGIAYALNRGIDYAKGYKANWLLTMDQDSSFSKGEFNKYINFISQETSNYEDAVIFSPIHKVPYLNKEDGVKKVKSVMTSGNFIKMDMVDSIGYFDERLFIDSVDHEYCYRINQMGYGVYRVNNIQLEHSLGDITTKKLFIKKIYVTNHNFVRRYYITRNLLYVVNTYSRTKLGYIRFACDHLFWSILSVALYEKEKNLKFKSILLGYIDYKRAKFGKKSF